MSNGNTSSRKESIHGLQKEVTVLCGSNLKEHLSCDICNMEFENTSNMKVHHAGGHVAHHSSSLKMVDCGCAAADEETKVGMLNCEGKGKCREESEGKVTLQCSAEASDLTDKSDKQANQVKISDSIESNGHDGVGGKDSLFLPPNSASHIPHTLLPEAEGGAQCEKQIECNLCDVVCPDRRSLEAHFLGRKHALMLKRSITKEGATLYSGVSEANNLDAASCGSKKRLRVDTDGKDVLLCEPSNNAASNGPDGGSIVKRSRVEDRKQISCKICNIECNSKRDLEVHSSGKKHAARLMKMLSGDAADGVGIAGSGNRIVRIGAKEQILEEGSADGAVSHMLEGNVSECPLYNPKLSDGSHDSVLVGKLGTKEGGLTGDDPSNIATEDCSVDEQHGEGLKTLLAKAGPVCNIKALAPPVDDFACAETEGPTVLDTLARLNRCQVIEKCDVQVSNGPEFKLAGDNVKTQKEHVLYELCSTDCENSMDGHVIVRMHATCLLRLLIMDKNACTGTAGAMLRCTLDKKGADETLQRNPLCNAPPSQLVSALKSEEVDTEEHGCKLCLVKCSSKMDLEIHLAGKRHAIQVKKLLGRCELCNVECGTSKILECHMAGKKHTSKLRLMQRMGDLQVDDVPPAVRQDSDGKAEDKVTITAECTEIGHRSEKLVM